MAKSIIKETIIMLLVCLAILLILCVLLYEFIPSNKVLPSEVSYQPSEEIQKELESAISGETTKVVLSYEVTSNDLNNYEKSNDYNPGKVNPFSTYIEEPEENLGNENNSNSETNSNTNSNSDSQNGGTYYPNGK